MKRKLELAATNTVSSTMSTSDNGIALQDKKAKAEQTKGTPLVHTPLITAI